jgi:hypothetical protein
MKSYPHIKTLFPTLETEFYPLLLGRWFQTEEHVVGVCGMCYRVVPALYLTLCILPFGKGEEWRCDECPGVRVRTNGRKK